ncbi:hypothetical protein TraAM80_00863 [Trypanosoma rangeli]|uniref:Uncharacterized protein n=1 Tax=Trypanosoma rangeli TaxID=5698 RepID=A0A422P1I0_TRYRA|nr:uncharacterized protein TraAM80_00863 [Trypanosoma rangeli]RNF11535.1 hypothetical protein TraAM80_00863 [Trypanosoma rangeli]|eukprot:RNF11535.1 hypothetical protein TraAM80_00863 [Trypanosoma rangeli]
MGGVKHSIVFPFTSVFVVRKGIGGGVHEADRLSGETILFDGDPPHINGALRSSIVASFVRGCDIRASFALFPDCDEERERFRCGCAECIASLCAAGTGDVTREAVAETPRYDMERGNDRPRVLSFAPGGSGKRRLRSRLSGRERGSEFTIGAERDDFFTASVSGRRSCGAGEMLLPLLLLLIGSDLVMPKCIAGGFVDSLRINSRRRRMLSSLWRCWDCVVVRKRRGG